MTLVFSVPLSSWTVPAPVFQKSQHCGSIMIVAVKAVALRTGGESKWNLAVTAFLSRFVREEEKKKEERNKQEH